MIPHNVLYVLENGTDGGMCFCSFFYDELWKPVLFFEQRQRSGLYPWSKEEEAEKMEIRWDGF